MALYLLALCLLLIVWSRKFVYSQHTSHHSLSSFVRCEQNLQVAQQGDDIKAWRNYHLQKFVRRPGQCGELQKEDKVALPLNPMSHNAARGCVLSELRGLPDSELLCPPMR